MCKILRIAGHSLEPEFRDGDYVLVSRIPFFFRAPHHGNVVAFTKPPYGVMIKRVEYLTQAGEVFVLGTHATSLDSLQFGLISRRDLLGKVVGHIHRPGRE